MKCVPAVAIRLAFLLSGVSVGVTAPVAAFELTPKPTRTEAALAKKTAGILFRSTYPIVEFGLHTFSNSVHEGLSHLAYDCPLGSLADCAQPDLDSANTGIIIGVRWNDDPPFQFAAGQGNYDACKSGKPAATVSFALSLNCWMAHFKDVSAIADARPDTYVRGDGTLLARTHFGDLQFLHAMAAQIGTPAAQTHKKILMWAEFTWRVQSHNRNESIPATTRMGVVPVSGLVEHFPVQEQRSVELLFTLGRPWARYQLRDIAFGSLLHMVQDSFAGGHVMRRASSSGRCTVPEIVEFHSYSGQNKSDHKARDSLDSANAKVLMEGSPLIVVMRELIRLRESDASWSEVQPYLQDCVFSLAMDAAAASTGVSE